MKNTRKTLSTTTLRSPTFKTTLPRPHIRTATTNTIAGEDSEDHNTSDDGEDEFEEEEEPTTHADTSDDEEDSDLIAILPIVEPLQHLPIVEPLQQPIPSAPKALTNDAVHSLFSSTLEDADFPDELAYLIGHKEGIVMGHQLTPIPIDKNKFEDRTERKGDPQGGEPGQPEW